ncbi:hypothetical protein DAPPUDRAFT_263288 [Daphnia pulex]|uniref:Uncharacterized protein n=1 Tax=Daphnia pulex TaxID=6669 RepID=E9HPG8_DAPPU|nr:hypothetical protein DAPPUDRAFT_263288 [Daphnia pulex]|eukprot:EFX66348.1 hypothetical protein DAPPUDRAFT_263288 [Daphnia pulex]
MASEALEFAKGTLTTGAQPAIVRKLLQDKFGTNLMGKNLINIKQTLQGKSQEEWEATAEYLQKLKKWFRAALYAVAEEDFAEEKSKLLTQYGKMVAAYFEEN